MKICLKILIVIITVSIYSCSNKSNKKEEIQKVESIENEVDSTHLYENISLKHTSEYDNKLVYTLQIGAFSKKNNTIDENSEMISTVEEDSLIKYRYGQFDSYHEALSFKRNVVSIYPDAFILAINKGHRIDIQTALKISNETVN
ncbi:SPOR domain-containing protein [Urechidicola croceus]|uniref:SPOR domain-containing protein n=1 Tax=Urechidicola croceus TaxID=1850246 RepID=A0A1D8P6Q4_9FLAO|nr:SPOR domain-containing protein [Urechidicola croceus]AOW20244.1 hypothetical protein LPB138_05935 [Urechidicola croceus]